MVSSCFLITLQAIIYCLSFSYRAKGYSREHESLSNTIQYNSYNNNIQKKDYLPTPWKNKLSGASPLKKE